MQYFSRLRLGLFTLSIMAIAAAFPHVNFTSLQKAIQDRIAIATPKSATCQSANQTPNFLVFAGGGAPYSNEIALEKNVLYFQRTLQSFGYQPSEAAFFFANGNDGQASIRYLDEQGREQLKIPEIPHLNGAATLTNFQNWIQQLATHPPTQPLFFYFTGHGWINEENLDNNAMILWNEDILRVTEFANLLEQLPSEKPVVTVMAQCFSGSFANFIYEGGDPNRPVALQTRCGFFATIKQLPSVGCTPAVNEADYQDYSSSFFAGLSGWNRIGQPVPSADYNQDGRVSYAEAHAFAKVDEETLDLPVSTSEVWLQEKASQTQRETILNQPMATLVQSARPEQRYVVESLAAKLALNLQQSYGDYLRANHYERLETDEKKAYLTRLGLELLNIGMAARIQASGNPSDQATLSRLIECEAGSWQLPLEKNESAIFRIDRAMLSE